MKRYLIYTVVAAMTFTLGVLIASLHLVHHDVYWTLPLLQPNSRIITEPTEKVKDFAGIFRDFVFVGSSPMDDSLVIPSHGVKEAHPLPQTFDVGHMYLFHLPAYEGKSFSLDAFYYAVLRDRLHAQGMATNFIVLPNGMPVSTMNRVRDEDYPVAEVRFWGKGYKGKVMLIHHEQNIRGEKLIARKHIQDYVLILQKQPAPEPD